MVSLLRMELPADGAGSPDHAQVAFPPPVVPLLGLALGVAAGRIWPLPFLPVGPAATVGRAITAASVALFVWAVATMLAGRASLPPHLPTNALVVHGPYRFSRNPIYLAMVVLLVGMGVATNNAWFLLLAVAGWWLLRQGVILREESYLERKFGAEYAAYRAAVRRWL